MDLCEECGFTHRHLPRDQIGGALREVARQHRSRLRATDPVALRRRPRPEVWAPLEYAAHVRDVVRVQRERISLALVHDVPTFASMRPEDRVVEDGYLDQDPEVVGEQIVGSADALAALLEALDDREWRRSGIYNWPTPEARDVAWIGRHTVHELVHHLFDVARSLQGQPGTPDGIGSGSPPP